MITMTLADVAAATGGEVVDADPAVEVTDLPFHDSRQPRPGGLYVAVAGERVDGHDFAAQAVEAGAVAVLAARPVGVPAVVVDDPVVALGRIASYVLDRLDALTVVGLTGSQGKTSTKDVLAQLLERLGPTVAPAGSYNTEVGVPETALRCDAATRYLVSEMGARGIGHIAYLCEMVHPSVALVLNVGVAHLGEYDDREQIAQAKGELVESLPAEGTAVLNADDPRVAAMAQRTRARVLTFGTREADLLIGPVTLDDHGHPSCTFTWQGETVDVTVPLVGGHQAVNAAGAATVALALGMPLTDVASALAAVESRSAWRMEVGESSAGVTVINDAYNANPDSMKAALTTIAELGSRRPESASVAVLGEMSELGPTASEEHRRIGVLAAELGISRVVGVGEVARSTVDGAAGVDAWQGRAEHVADADAALEALRGTLHAGDIVLVKASRAIGLEKLAQALCADGNTDEGDDA